ncbi:protein of unknown function [Methylocella tundrae]|uniref:Uncharacterized protein n=1 Tax=Methylocella tundrae TaxID=227605 RepID=A0A4U8Z0A6_METTU|nr:protein of unknown function [Methylocella tundrae]
MAVFSPIIIGSAKFITESIFDAIVKIAAGRKSEATVALETIRESWLGLSKQFSAKDKWRSAGLLSLEGAGCWV